MESNSNAVPELREEVIGSRIAFQGNLLRIRVDDVRLPSGRLTVREIVDHPGAVAIVPLTADGNVLLIRQYRSAVRRTLLEIPAGTREPNEPAAETARRELIEEIAHAPGSLTEVATYYSSAGYSSEQITLFLAEDCRPVPAVEAAEETISLFPVPIADVPALLVDPTHPVQDGKTLIGLLWLLRRD